MNEYSSKVHDLIGGAVEVTETVFVLRCTTSHAPSMTTSTVAATPDSLIDRCLNHPGLVLAVDADLSACVVEMLRLVDDLAAEIVDT